MRVFVAWTIVFSLAELSLAGQPHASVPLPDLPDQRIVEAYQRAATQNVLAAVFPEVFFGYFAVNADRQSPRYGMTFPSLDGHQMTDALLFLGQLDVAKANFDYVRSKQRSDGQLPMCIYSNGQSLFLHWAKGDPLRALAAPTYIQNADVIYRYTQDRPWLAKQLASINREADYLASLVTADGKVAARATTSRCRRGSNSMGSPRATPPMPSDAWRRSMKWPASRRKPGGIGNSRTESRPVSEKPFG